MPTIFRRSIWKRKLAMGRCYCVRHHQTTRERGRKTLPGHEDPQFDNPSKIWCLCHLRARASGALRDCVDYPRDKAVHDLQTLPCQCAILPSRLDYAMCLCRRARTGAVTQPPQIMLPVSCKASKEWSVKFGRMHLCRLPIRVTVRRIPTC